MLVPREPAWSIGRWLVLEGQERFFCWMRLGGLGSDGLSPGLDAGASISA